MFGPHAHQRKAGFLGRWRLAAGAALTLVAGANLWSAEPVVKAKPAIKASAGGVTVAATSGPAVESPGATHQQDRVIRPADGETDWSLASFCLTKDGRIAAVLNRRDSGAAHGGIVNSRVGAPTEHTATENKPASPAEVRLLDADGKPLQKWPLDFAAQVINVGPDNSLYLGGDGVLARFNLDGKELARGKSPLLEAARKDTKELERQARETLEQQRHQLDAAIKQLEARRDQLKNKHESDLTKEERQQLAQLDQAIAIYKQMGAKQQQAPITDADVKAFVSQMAAQDKRVNAIAAGTKYVYTATRETKGYGYRVWRTDLDFKNAKPVVDGLSGCCGQMDIQCCDDELIVSENSRYRVTRYDSEGKKLASFGKSQRDGAGEGFSGCCNPMNTRPLGDKLYVAESNGVVKLFSRDGKYQGTVGAAKVQPGCKSSIVDVSADGNRVYYFDVFNSAICVLQRGPAKPDAH